jgi:ribosomal 30S subunit maturation factor RimM
VSGTPLLVVDTRGGELLIPLAEDICTGIDLRGRRIEVVLPEGLRDLNRA